MSSLGLQASNPAQAVSMINSTETPDSLSPQSASETSQSEMTSPRVHRAAGRMSTGAQIAGALKDLITLNQPGSKQTQGARAMQFFQEYNSSNFDDVQQLSIINVFYSERRAALYMSIQRKDLRTQWLLQQIEERGL